MALYGIGDLHLSLGGNKPMDVFSGWDNYVERLCRNWENTVRPEDTVVLAGDISWAMKLEETEADFCFIHALPGRKILLKGNHDYWWSTAAKMQGYVAGKGFDTLHFLHNNAFALQNAAICGTRGWTLDADEAQDAKVQNRELGRLRLSLLAAPAGAEKIAFLHYPPLCAGSHSTAMTALLHEFGVKRCYYGHLHSAAIQWAVQGVVDGVDYRLISADSVDFCPVPIPLY